VGLKKKETTSVGKADILKPTENRDNGRATNLPNKKKQARVPVLLQRVKYAN
jgi:hypothetical protein